MVVMFFLRHPVNHRPKTRFFHLNLRHLIFVRVYSNFAGWIDSRVPYIAIGGSSIKRALSMYSTSALSRYMIGEASLQVLESLMRLREKRRNPHYYQVHHPKWFGNENGQNIRKAEFKSRRRIKLPKNLKPAFEIEVHLQIPPSAVTPDQLN